MDMMWSNKIYSLLFLARLVVAVCHVVYDLAHICILDLLFVRDQLASILK